MALGGGARKVVNSQHHAAYAFNEVVAPTTIALSGRALASATGLASDPAIECRLRQMIA